MPRGFLTLPLLCLAPAAFAAAGSPTAASIAQQLHQAAFDPAECYRVTELALAREDLKIYFTSGYLILAKPVNGVRPAALFSAKVEAGDGEILLLPPTRGERASLAVYTGSPNLEEHFGAALLISSGGMMSELEEQIRRSPGAKKSPEMGALLGGEWNATLRNLSSSFETRLVHDILSPRPGAGFFYMAVGGARLGNFDVMHDPELAEQVITGQLATRNGRAYFDTWTSFADRSTRQGGKPYRPLFAVDNYRIDSTIAPDLGMKIVTRATIIPKGRMGRAARFFIARDMRVTAATIDGHPAEVFQRESLRSNLIHSNENEQFLVVAPEELDPARPHEIEFQHEGAVIARAGERVFFVGSRGTWYPRQELDFARYDLTFRYPSDLQLVSTGETVEDRVEGDVHITRRKTDSPIRFAGFNLGDYQKVSITRDSYRIEVCANRRLERALEPKAAPAPAPQPWNRTRRTNDPLLAGLTPPPSPTARLEAIAQDVAAAFEFMTAEFGKPPMHTLTVSPIPGGFGQGFPGLVYLSTLAYLDPAQRPAGVRDRQQQTFYSELIESHEVAHQWWGNLVTPASYQDEWLMEALSNYTALLLLERKKGAKAVDAILDDYKKQLLAKTESGRTAESAGPITWGYRLQTSQAPDAWRVITYEKGSWIIHMLRRRMGDESFLKMLREVCARFRFSPLSTEQFREVAKTFLPAGSPDADLKSFFEAWVYGTGVPAVKLQYAQRGMKLSGTLAQREVDDDFSAYVPVEVLSAKGKTVYWLPTGGDPAPFSLAVKQPHARAALDVSGALMTVQK